MTMAIILESQQQKNQLLQLLQMVEITGPFVTAQQQIIQVQDMLQTVATAEVKPPEVKPQEIKKEAK